MTCIMDMLKGMLIGIANVIPGVSGGTIALSLGIYDKLIGAVSGLLKDWKKSLKTLAPIIIGCGIGIICFTYLIEYLLSAHTFVTCMAFVGLILGGLPILIKNLKQDMKKSGRGAGISGILAFLILFCIAVFLPLLGSDEEVLKTLTPSAGTMVIMFLLGVIASATMVIPGVSGSLVLMILGYYYGIIGTIKGSIEALKVMDIAGVINGALLIAPFGIGVLLGIFLIAKLITWLFNRYGVQTYCAILGLILSSPFAIFYNTGLMSQLGSLAPVTIVIGIVAAAVGGVVTCFMGEK